METKDKALPCVELWTVGAIELYDGHWWFIDDWLVSGENCLTMIILMIDHTDEYLNVL